MNTADQNSRRFDLAARQWIAPIAMSSADFGDRPDYWREIDGHPVPFHGAPGHGQIAWKTAKKPESHHYPMKLKVAASFSHDFKDYDTHDEVHTTRSMKSAGDLHEHGIITKAEKDGADNVYTIHPHTPESKAKHEHDRASKELAELSKPDGHLTEMMSNADAEAHYAKKRARVTELKTRIEELKPLAGQWNPKVHLWKKENLAALGPMPDLEGTPEEVEKAGTIRDKFFAEQIKHAAYKPEKGEHPRIVQRHADAKENIKREWGEKSAKAWIAGEEAEQRVNARAEKERQQAKDDAARQSKKTTVATTPKAASTSGTVFLRGNTFANKDALKAKGFRWHPEKKAWHGPAHLATNLPRGVTTHALSRFDLASRQWIALDRAINADGGFPKTRKELVTGSHGDLGHFVTIGHHAVFIDDQSGHVPDRLKPHGDGRRFTKAHIERHLTEHFKRHGGDEHVDAIAKDLEENAGGGHGHSPFTFKDKLPEEVKTAMEGHGGGLKRLFRVAKTAQEKAGATGEDAWSHLGEDKYMAFAEAHAGSPVRLAKEHAHKSDDPEVQFLAHLHDHMPKRGEGAAPIHGLNPNGLRVGDAFKVGGQQFRVLSDQHGDRVLRGGTDFPETPVDALRHVPHDAGSFRPGKIKVAAHTRYRPYQVAAHERTLPKKPGDAIPFSRGGFSANEPRDDDGKWVNQGAVKPRASHGEELRTFTHESGKKHAVHVQSGTSHDGKSAYRWTSRRPDGSVHEAGEWSHDVDHAAKGGLDYAKVNHTAPRQEASPAPAAKPANHAEDATHAEVGRVARAMSPNLNRVWISDLRKKLPHLSAEQVDSALLHHMNSGDMVGVHGDDPQEMRQVAGRKEGAFTTPGGEKRHLFYWTGQGQRLSRFVVGEGWIFLDRTGFDPNEPRDKVGKWSGGTSVKDRVTAHTDKLFGGGKPKGHWGPGKDGKPQFLVGTHAPRKVAQEHSGENPGNIVDVQDEARQATKSGELFIKSSHRWIDRNLLDSYHHHVGQAGGSVGQFAYSKSRGGFVAKVTKQVEPAGWVSEHPETGKRDFVAHDKPHALFDKGHLQAVQVAKGQDWRTMPLPTHKPTFTAAGDLPRYGQPKAEPTPRADEPADVSYRRIKAANPHLTHGQIHTQVGRERWKARQSLSRAGAGQQHLFEQGHGYTQKPLFHGGQWRVVHGHKVHFDDQWNVSPQFKDLFGNNRAISKHEGLFGEETHKPTPKPAEDKPAGETVGSASVRDPKHTAEMFPEPKAAETPKAEAYQHETPGEAAKAGKSFAQWRDGIYDAFRDEKIDENHPAWKQAGELNHKHYNAARDLYGKHVRTDRGHFGKVTGVSDDMSHVLVTHDDGTTTKQHPEGLDHAFADLKYRAEGGKDVSGHLAYLAPKMAQEAIDKGENIGETIKRHGLSITTPGVRAAVAAAKQKIKPYEIPSAPAPKKSERSEYVSGAGNGLMDNVPSAQSDKLAEARDTLAKARVPHPDAKRFLDAGFPEDEAHALAERYAQVRGEKVNADKVKAARERLRVRAPKALGPATATGDDSAVDHKLTAKMEATAKDDMEKVRAAAVARVKAKRAGVSLSRDDDEHSFSSTQINLPSDVAAEVLKLAHAIPDEDLAADGRETNPHVTVKYGLNTRDADKVKKHLGEHPPVNFSLGKTSLFNAPDFDVVKIDVDGDELHGLHHKISGLPHTDTHPKYQPHVTLAYVKKGKGDKYVGKSAVTGTKVAANKLRFSSKAGNCTDIPLSGQPVSLSRVYLSLAPTMSDETADATTEVELNVGGTKKKVTVSRWKKDVLAPGSYVHPLTKQAFTVTPADIDGFVAKFKLMREAGIDIGVPVDHKMTAEANRGWVVDAEKTDSGRLRLTHELFGDDAALLAMRNRASVLIDPNYHDEFGKSWGKCIVHSALTPIPVITGMGGFEAAA